MAAPLVFISSTYYDLKYLRSSLSEFVKGLGYDPVLSEKGSIAYAPDDSLDESCYRSAKQSDIFVLIIGGRYGSLASSEDKKKTKGFFDRYDSITKKEYKAAQDEGVPTYIMIERGVYSEYQTFRRNKEKKDIKYAFVDSINIFLLIEEILSKSNNNPVHEFDTGDDIESWLRLQWSGLFKDLLNRRTQQEQLTSLTGQVALLSDHNQTLRRYLESIITKLRPEESKTMIEEESTRLGQKIVNIELSRSPLIVYLLRFSDFNLDLITNLIIKAGTVNEFVAAINAETDKIELLSEVRSERLMQDINKAREVLNLSNLEWEAPSK